MKKYIVFVFCLLGLIRLDAQYCPTSIQCNVSGGISTVMVFYSDGAVMPVITTFLDASGNELASQGPSNPNSNPQMFQGLSFCTVHDAPLTVTLVLDGQVNSPCVFVNGELQSYYGAVGCPESKGCINNPADFYITFDPDNTPNINGWLESAHFYFNDYPCLNGVHNYTYSKDNLTDPSLTDYVYRQFNEYAQCSELLNFTIVFGSETDYPITCVFQDGLYCSTCDPVIPVGESDCNHFLNSCGSAILQYVDDSFEWDEGNCSYWGDRCSPNALIKRYGDVRIGTSEAPPGYKLAVKGTVYTEEFKLCVDSWCDYVFDENYDLWSLSKVEKFITNNGHLPNIPSTECVEEEGGFDLEEVTFKQQEKIEEIFLHLIDLNKQLSGIDTLMTN
jgi:hypothetical protein